MEKENDKNLVMYEIHLNKTYIRLGLAEIS